MRGTRVAAGWPPLRPAPQLAGLKRPTNVNLPIRRHTGRPGDDRVVITGAPAPLLSWPPGPVAQTHLGHRSYIPHQPPILAHAWALFYRANGHHRRHSRLSTMMGPRLPPVHLLAMGRAGNGSMSGIP
jgi:hypothetical protein